jgi:hypothetical protein
LEKLYQVKPESLGDLQGVTEIFDLSVRSFEKRFDLIERYLSIEVPLGLQNNGVFSGYSSVFFLEDITENIATNFSIFCHVPSVIPESSIHRSSFLSDVVPSILEGNFSNFTFNAILPSDETSNLSVISADNSPEVAGTDYSAHSVNKIFYNVSESLRSLQTAILELSNFTHNDLQPNIKKLYLELHNLKAQQDTKDVYIQDLEFRLEILEKQNKCTIGSLEIPIEVSGVISSSVLFLIGFFILSDRWDIITSPYFSIGLALLMAGAIFIKFYMATLRKKVMNNKF